MEIKKRTPKETAQVVEKTISEIRKVLSAVPIMTGYNFFDEKKFKQTGFDLLVKKTCKKYEINEKHIRKIAEWEIKK